MSSPTPDLPLDAELEPGHVIGEYEIESKIGQGGFGTVFKAVHPLIGKVVAIKVLARRFSADPEMVSRFIAEARSVNQIRNRYIIDIFLFGQLDDGRNYYVMEYLDGEPLDTLIGQRGHVELAEALPILRGIAKALDAAHAKGIAHRDLKPENVFIVRDPDGGVGSPKLLDFGIAKLMGEAEGGKARTRTGIPIGTPYYMSPEQCRGKDVDHRTDFYAFGVLAYELLTGVRPIDGDDYMEIMMRQLTHEPVAPSTVVPELPPGIDAAIAWLVKKDRDERPPTLAAAMQAFEAAAAAIGIAVRPPTGLVDVPALPDELRARLVTPVPGRTPGVPSAGLARTMPSGAELEPARRRRWPIVVAGLVAAAAIAVVAIAMVASRPPDAPVRKIAAPTVVAAPAPAPTPTPTPAAPAPAATIITVAGVPEGTEVSVAGAAIGVAPGPVQLPRGTSQIVLTFKADGYLPASRAVMPDRDQRLVLALRKRPSVVRHDKDSIIDPFGKGASP